MTEYRLYCLDGVGKITHAEWLEAKSDDEAIILARARKLPVRCELWHGNRRIAEIPAHAD